MTTNSTSTVLVFCDETAEQSHVTHVREIITDDGEIFYIGNCWRCGSVVDWNQGEDEWEHR